LFSLNYASGKSPEDCLSEAIRYGQSIKREVTSSFTEWTCAKHPERLRVGFVSGDFNKHPVGYFLENLLHQLDTTAIDLIAYPTSTKTDELTTRIKPLFSAWKTLFGLKDEAAAQMIHNDGVHILIDLAGHSSNNRLPVFAWKPAPVQASWLGYFATTGVTEIDYLIADPWTLPESEEVYFTEEIWRLPETRLCFTPPDIDLEVSVLPALTNGYTTFGCFNNLTKMNDDVVALWSRLLLSIPNSRLFLKSKQLNEAAVRQHTIERFAGHGIKAGCLILEGYESREQYLAAYQRVDIALDPFPFPGGTTSAEGLWMGVPVLTLAGERFLSRQGVGILMNTGLPDWVARDKEDYVALATAHAADLQRLSELRNELRQQVLKSPFMDGRRFASHFKDALIGMYQAWNERQDGE
jgi:predicted O-linked N-acetylglucosamine transferase (SPINDLY family)